MKDINGNPEPSAIKGPANTFIANTQIEALARNAALNNDVDPDVAMMIARLLFSTAAVSQGSATATVTLKLHDTSTTDGQLRAHGKYGICLACIKVETMLGHICASIAPGSQRCCVLGDTCVVLASGVNKKALDLEVDDYILAYDTESCLPQETRVTAIWKEHIREGYYLINGELTVTGDHPVLVENCDGSRSWKKIENLLLGERITSTAGCTVVSSKTYVRTYVPTVYIETEAGNFIVAGAVSDYVLNAKYALMEDKLLMREEMVSKY